VQIDVYDSEEKWNCNYEYWEHVPDVSDGDDGSDVVWDGQHSEEQNHRRENPQSSLIN
jgi:hypothetical protein